MTFLALGRALGLFLVATLAPDVEGVLLGAGYRRIIRVGVFSVAFETTLGIILTTSVVVTDRTIVAF